MSMTKTDARELKSLVKSDFATLEERTEHRYREMSETLKAERIQRNREIQEQAEKDFASLRAQYTRLANKTRETLDQLANQGWCDPQLDPYYRDENLDRFWEHLHEKVTND